MNLSTAMVLVVGLVVVAAIAWMMLRRRHSRELRAHFGPEYDRLVEQRGKPSRAEAELDRRARRMARLSIRPLGRDAITRYAQEWNAQQTRFVDEPKAAVVEADHLVEEVMRERGYPVGEFEQRAADISVDHPQLVENYRAAHEIAVREHRGQANTEDLRNAMIHYRELFRELLEDHPRTAGATQR